MKTETETREHKKLNPFDKLTTKDGKVFKDEKELSTKEAHAIANKCGKYSIAELITTVEKIKKLHIIASKQQVCRHARREYPTEVDNIDGKYYDYICTDCGYKRTEGRSYASREMEETFGYIKFNKKRTKEQTIRCLALIHAMAADALNRLNNEKRGDKYFEKVF